MHLFLWPLTIILGALAGAACDDTNGLVNGDGNGDGNGAPQGGLAVERIADGLDDPVHLATAPGDPRTFVVEQAGRIRIIEDGGVRSTPFLDIAAKVRSGGERGLLSVAFHPDYADNGFFYVNYTRAADGASRVERYSVSADPNVADAGSAVELLTVSQPFSNHNGGLNVFGPDDMLYIGLGDGGSGGDPQGNGQDSTTLLGSILRIDVDAAEPYGVPPDNPFVGRSGADEVWAYGLRNPWRFSFDRSTGDLYIADVGQNRFEEVSFTPFASAGGLNYGWNVMEGRHCFDPPEGCSSDGLILPVLEYGHDGGACSVTGGFVYRGASIPDVEGHYFYSDFCTGFLRSFRVTESGITDETEWDVGDLGSVTSFGEDAAGELYIVSDRGIVFRLIEASGGDPDASGSP